MRGNSKYSERARRQSHIWRMEALEPRWLMSGDAVPIGPLELLRIVNALNDSRQPNSANVALELSHNREGSLTPRDALLVINQFHRQSIARSMSVNIGTSANGNVPEGAWSFEAPASASATSDIGAAAIVADQEPRGYYLLQSAQTSGQIPASILNDPDVAGIVLRRFWSEVNPSSGTYNWTYLDREISRAASAGKKVQIVIFAGVSAPAWVYTAGAKAFYFTDPRYGSTQQKMPVPWDPVMLAKWDTFVRAMGARYDSNTTVTLVHMAGPTRFSAEMILPDSITQLTGYSTTKVVDAWTTTIRSYQAAFPNTAVALNVGHAVNSDNSPALVAAKAVELLGDRVTLQHNSLSAKTSNNYDVHSLLKNYAAQGVRVGFEMLSISSESRFGGTLQKAINIGRAVGAKYLAVYPADQSKLIGPY